MVCRERDPQRALRLLCLAVVRPYASSNTYVVLGKVYAQLIQRELTLDSCRRAYWRGRVAPDLVAALAEELDRRPDATATRGEHAAAHEGACGAIP